MDRPQRVRLYSRNTLAMHRGAGVAAAEFFHRYPPFRRVVCSIFFRRSVRADAAECRLKEQLSPLFSIFQLLLV